MANHNSNNIKIGLLVIAAVALAIFGLSYLKGKKLLGSDPMYYSIFESAQGLSKSHKVVINGVNVGKVEDVQLIDNFQRVKITYSLDERISIPTDSKVLISTGIPGFGNPQMDINVGTDKEKFAANSQIPVLKQTSLLEKTENIVGELEPTSKSLKSTMHSLDSLAKNMNVLLGGQNAKNIESAIANMNSTMGTLNSASKKVDGLVDAQTAKIDEILSNLQSLSQTLKANQKYIDNTLANFSKTSDELASLELKQTLDRTTETINKLNSILAKVENGEGSLSLLLNDAELYNNLNNTARDLDRLILDIKSNPREVVPSISIFGGKKKK